MFCVMMFYMMTFCEKVQRTSVSVTKALKSFTSGVRMEEPG